MHPNEILPAIPRQKIRNIDTGVVADVIVLHADEDFATVKIEGKTECAWLHKWEPVPEEPRPLRIGDKVVTHAGTFSTIAAIRTESENMHSYKVQHSDYDFYENQLRHATPEELAKYF